MIVYSKDMQYRGVGCCYYSCKAVQSLRFIIANSSHALPMSNNKACWGILAHFVFMKIVYYILTFLLTFFITPIYGQGVFNLKGKNITITNLPSPLSNYGKDRLKKDSKKFGNIYHIEALKTKSFKDKFLYKENILGKEIHIKDVFMLNNENKKKRTLVISFSYQKDTLFLYYPMHLITNIMYMGFSVEHDKKPEELDIKYYNNDSLRLFAKTMKENPVFYYGDKYIFKDIKCQDAQYFFECDDANSKPRSFEINPNSTTSNQERTLFAYCKNIMLERDLINKCKQSIDSVFIHNFIKKFSNKEVYLEMGYGGESGFYQCNKIEITNTSDKIPLYEYIMLLTKDNTEKRLPISEKIAKYIVLADEYREEQRLLKEKEEREEQEQQAIFAQEEAQEKARLIKKYGKRKAQLILDEKVEIGFTKQMCIEAWGEPQDINRTITRNRVHEQWVYGIGCYLYFEGNYLTAIQN